MECVPNASTEVLNVASPFLSVALPTAVVPFLKVTVPVGVPPVEVTVAAKVTAAPKVDGFSEDRRVVLVATPLTDRTIGAPTGSVADALNVLNVYCPEGAFGAN